MKCKTFEMHKHGDYGVFYSENHQNLLKQIIQLMGYRCYTINILDWLGNEFEQTKVYITDVDDVCHKLILLGWQRC